MSDGPSDNLSGSGGGINLDACRCSLEATDRAIHSQFRTETGTQWELRWSIESDDLVLRTSVRTADPIGVFRMALPAWTFRRHQMVVVNGTGTGIVQSPPWTGEQSTSVPLVLFEGDQSGWLLEARELEPNL